MQCNMRRYKAHRCSYMAHAAVTDTTFTELIVRNFFLGGGGGGGAGVFGGESSPPSVDRTLIAYLIALCLAGDGGANQHEAMTDHCCLVQLDALVDKP